MSKWWDKSITLVEGCSPVSTGCEHCWSAGMAHRFRRSLTTTKGAFNGKIICREDRLGEILKRKKPTRWTIWNDLFHPGVPFEFIDKVFDTMLSCRQHTFQLLTKRPERALEYYDGVQSDSNIMGEPAMIDSIGANHIHLGVTVCNQKEADEKIPILLQIPAAKRFLSIEPMLGVIDLSAISKPEQGCVKANVLDRHGKHCGLDWVIVGGESGPGARPMHPDWARGIRDQCQAAGVPFFFKQWGKHLPANQYESMDENTWRAIDGGGVQPTLCGLGNLKTWKLGKKKAGCLLDGREHKEMPNDSLRTKKNQGA